MKRTKKIALIMLAVVLMAVCFVFGASAERTVVISGNCGAEGDNVTYVLYDDGELVISGEGAMEDYGESNGGGGSWSPGKIPWYDYDVVSIKVNEGVTRIGNASFTSGYDRESLLQRVELPDSLVEIGEIAFSRCSSLVDIVLPDNLVSIGAGAFESCYSLKEIVIPDGVSTIENSAFSGCSSVKKVVLGKGVKLIKTNAFNFYSNSALQIVEYKGSEEALADIIICSGNDMFVELLTGKATEEITVDGLIYKIIGNNAVLLGYTSDINKNLVIPVYVQGYPVVVIEPRALQCAEITSLVLPDTVVEINYYAFAQCTELKDISFGKGLLKIGNTAFSDCNSLENINLPDTLEIIEEQAFSECGNLKSVIIPDSVKYLGEDAFYRCTLLETADVGDGVETIGRYAFGKCWSLKSIRLGKNVKNIEYDSIVICTNLVEIIVDEENPYFYSDENGALYDKLNSVLIKYPEANPAESYKIKEGTKEIGMLAFGNNLYLQNIEIPSSVKTIAEGAFQLSSGLKEITIPETVEFIGAQAFIDSFSLEKIYFLGENLIIDEPYLTGVEWELSEMTFVELAELFRQIGIAEDNGDFEKSDEIYNVIFKHFLAPEEGVKFKAVFYVHDDSKTYSAENYAIENGMPYDRCHFYADEWNYDYDNMVRYRECTFAECSARIEEPLESTENGDVEIIEPVDPDTDFEVEEITGENFLLVEEKVVNGIEGNVEVLKAFDINLKNSEGVHVQPNGTIKVKLPNDWSKNGIYKVYRVNDDGTLTDMNAYREGSHLVFDTDHFSIYVIVFVPDETTEPEPEVPDTPAEPDTESCDCICHATGFLNRILAFVYRIFLKLLGTAPVCACGAAHY